MNLTGLPDAVDVKDAVVNLVSAREHPARVQPQVENVSLLVIVVELGICACLLKVRRVPDRQLTQLVDEELLAPVEKAHQQSCRLALSLNELHEIELLIDAVSRVLHPFPVLLLTAKEVEEVVLRLDARPLREIVVNRTLEILHTTNMQITVFLPVF